MAILRELMLRLGLDVDEASFAKGQLAADGVKLGLEKIVEWGKAGAEALLHVATEAIETAAHLDDTSQAIGVSTDALQELAYAAGQSGLSSEELEKSITLLSRSMNAAKQGGESQIEMFSRLGVKTKDAAGKLRPAEAVINDIADKLSKMPDGAEKTALAMEAFGKSGAKMLPLLNEGSDGIERLRQEARDLGLVMDEDLIKQGAQIDDIVTSLKDMWKAIKGGVGASLFPTILKTAKAFRDWVKENRVLIQQNLTRLFEGLAFAGRLLFSVFSETIKIFERNYDIWKRSAEIIGLLLIPMAARFAIAWAAAVAPLVALAAALGGIVLFIDDFAMFLEYGEEANTVTGQFLKNVDRWMEPKQGDPWWITALKDFLGMIRETLKAMKELNALINGTKMHEEADAAAARDPRDVQRQADTATAASARKRAALGLPQTQAERDALERLRQSAPEQFFAAPSGNPFDFSTRRGNYEASPRLERSINQADTRVNNTNNFAPVVNVYGGDPIGAKEKLIPLMQEFWDGKMEDAANGGD